MCKCENEENEDSCCQDGCCSRNEESMGDVLMDMADRAWDELMYEKIKAAMEKKKGAKMEKVAAIVVETSSALWEGKMLEKEKWQEFEDKLEKAMKD